MTEFKVTLDVNGVHDAFAVGMSQRLSRSIRRG